MTDWTKPGAWTIRRKPAPVEPVLVTATCGHEVDLNRQSGNEMCPRCVQELPKLTDDQALQGVPLAARRRILRRG